MIVYNYDNKTFEYKFERIAEKSQVKEDEFIIPAFSTTIKPKSTKAGFTQCFDETLQKWEYVEDNREKKVYIKANRQQIEVDYLGALKDEHTLLVPKEFDKWDEVSKSWIEDKKFKKEYENIQKKAQKVEQLNTLVVTTSQGNIFDGNETARLNMVSAIQSAELLGQTENNWKMADNSVKLITLAELKEALALSIQKVGEIVTA